jgi:MFS family permease
MLSRSNTNLYLSSLTAGLTAALFGYSIGFIGGLLILPSFLSNYHLLSLSPSSLASVRSTIVSSWLFGALLGVPIAIPICSKLGRKHCLFFSASLYILGTVLQLVDFSGSGENAIWMFDTGRLINGIGVGAGTLVGPMYISEISPKEMRGLLMSGYQTILQLSALAGFWITYFCHSLISDNNHLQFQLPIAIQLALGTFMMLGTCGVVESPRFLAEKGGEGVEESLAWLRGMGDRELNTDLVEEVEEIIEAARISRVTGGKGESFAKEVMKRGTRRRLAVGVGLMIAQNMVGLNALNYCWFFLSSPYIPMPETMLTSR